MRNRNRLHHLFADQTTSHLANNDHRLVTSGSVMPRTPAFLESLLPLDLELELTDSVLRRSAMGVQLCLDQPTT